MNITTVKKWVKLAKLTKNPLDFVLDEHGRKSAPWIIRFRDGLQLEIRPNRGDSGAFRESWLQRDYLAHGQVIRPGDTVIDIGANIGCFTVYAARAVGPTGRVIAVEPAAETFGQLRRNVELNNLHNVTLVKAAVAGAAGEVALTSSENSLFSSIFDKIDGRDNTGSVELVEALTFADLLARNGVDHVAFLKLDCEGAEHGIVETITADTLDRVDQISMELHEVEGVESTNLLRRLRSEGYSMAREDVLVYFRREMVKARETATSEPSAGAETAIDLEPPARRASMSPEP